MENIPQLSGTIEEQTRQLNYLVAEGFTVIQMASPITVELPRRKLVEVVKIESSVIKRIGKRSHWAWENAEINGIK